MTGVEVSKSLQSVYTALRSRVDKCFEYLSARINEQRTEIKIEDLVEGEKLSSQQKFELFVDSLPADQCKYIIYNYRCYNEDESIVKKLILITWCPDQADAEEKNLYYDNRVTVKRSLVGIDQEIIGIFEEDLDYEILKKLFT